MIALDTDVLAIYHIFHKDPRYNVTKKLFNKLNDQPKAVTIFNLLEFCGILASATKKEDSITVFYEYLNASDIEVLFPQFHIENEMEFWSTLISECLSRIQKGLRLGDAAILWALETNSDIDALIT
jgi:predicted nucleic acid-binding protein